MTPSEYFKKPVIGKIHTKGIVDEGIYEYDVISIENHFYVCNQWYKDYKYIPQLVPLEVVISYEPLLEVVI